MDGWDGTGGWMVGWTREGGWMDGLMSRWVGEWMDIKGGGEEEMAGWMDGWMDGKVGGWIG